MEIRDARFGDVGGIREVALATWADAYRGIIPEDEQTAFLGHAYSDASLAERMASGAFLVAEEDGRVVGFADFSSLPGGEAELAAIYVLPASQGRGLGSRLLEAGLGRLPAVSKIRVGVERENAAARGFYESRSFVEEPAARAFADGPGMLWMVLEIDGSG